MFDQYQAGDSVTLNRMHGRNDVEATVIEVNDDSMKVRTHEDMLVNIREYDLSDR